MSQATPRKFSEKIAILERKQNEEQEQFNSVMRDVRTITNNDQQQQPNQNSRQATPQSIPQQPQNDSPSKFYGAPKSNDSSCGSKLSPEGPHPLTTNWNRAGGSLPNVHQMVQQPMGSGGPTPYGGWSPSWTNMPAATSAAGGQQVHQQQVRTRSPGAPHFHPYRNGVAGSGPGGGGGRHDQQHRMSQGETSTSGGATIAGVHLQPPDPTWSKARSDPAIHTAAMTATSMDPNGFMSAYPFYPGQAAGQWPLPDGKMFNGPATAPTSAAIMPHSMPMAFFPTAYPFAGGLPSTAGVQQMHQPPPQQMYMPPQQLGSPSSSSAAAAIQQQQNAYLANNVAELTGMMGSPAQVMVMQQNNHQGQQQGSKQQQMNNFGNFRNCTPMAQQQMMAAQNNNINRAAAAYQQQSQQQQQQFVGGGTFVVQPPPMYSATTASQQQGMAMKMAAINHHAGHQQQLISLPPGLSQSQSAPTSPAAGSLQCSMENPLARQQQQQWANRHFSASPDTMEVPNICVTGTDGSLDVDCFQDLQDLHLDSETLQMLKDPTANEQVDPACETQLLS